MAEHSSTMAETASTLSTVMSQLRAVDAKLDADSISALQVADLKTANLALQPVWELSESLQARKPVELDEAVVYLRDGKLCELLLSLLRRLPWLELQQSAAVMREGLFLLSFTLSSLSVFLRAATYVCSSQQASAYAEMSKRCLSQACAHPALPRPGNIGAYECFKLAAVPVIAQHWHFPMLQVQSSAGL